MVHKDFEQALYILRHILPSVCPTVTFQHCVKTRERREMRSLPSGSRVSVVSDARMVDGGRPCPGKISVQRGRPSCENSQAVHILPHNSRTVIDSKKYPNLSFSEKFRQKAFKVCYKVFLPKKFQKQSCSTINHLSNGNILAGDDPFHKICA